MPLADRPCTPADADASPLVAAERAPLAAEVPTWRVIDGHHLEREVKLADFRAALALVVAIGDLAEEVGHHPDLRLSWGHVGITLYTHAIDGLAECDFVLAARIERLIARHGTPPEPRT